MPTPGPWVQPADVDRVAERFSFGANEPWTTSVVSAESLSSYTDLLAQTAIAGVNAEDPSDSEVSTSYDSGPSAWTGAVSLLRPDSQFVSLAPVPPTPAELAAPHVVGYEYEGGPSAEGVLVSDLEVTTWLRADGWSSSCPTGPGDPANILEYRVYEMVEGVDFSVSPVVYGAWTFQQVHTILWPNQSRLGARTVIGTNHAGTFGVNNTPQTPADGFSFTTPAAAPATFAFVDSHLYSGVDSLDPSLLLLISPSVQVSATVRPPRWRLLYDYVPQRQYPRDDGLAISTKRTFPQRTSRQFSSRRGPAGTYL